MAGEYSVREIDGKLQYIYSKIVIPENMHLFSLEHYASSILPFEVQDDNCWINTYGAVTSQDNDSLFVVQIDDNHFRLLPGPEFSPRLYRGQTTIYEECLPSLFRKPFDPIRYMVNILKKYEFYKAIASHPIVNYLDKWFIDGKQFSLDFKGLAAHYEFATSMVDVSKSKDVAMFLLHVKKTNKQGSMNLLQKNTIKVFYTLLICKLYWIIGMKSSMSSGFRHYPARMYRKPILYGLEILRILTIILLLDTNYSM